MSNFVIYKAYVGRGNISIFVKKLSNYLILIILVLIVFSLKIYFLKISFSYKNTNNDMLVRMLIKSRWWWQIVNTNDINSREDTFVNLC